MSGNPPDLTPAARAALSRAVGASSLRSVARQVGMSTTGLKNFLEREEGGETWPSTDLKLARWMVTHAEGLPQEHAVEAAIAVVTAGLPPLEAERERVRILAARARGLGGMSTNGGHQAEFRWTPRLEAAASALAGTFPMERRLDALRRVREAVEAMWKEEHRG